MAIFIRLFILAFIFELGAIYSIQAEVNTDLNSQLSQNKTPNNTYSLRECNNLFSDFVHYELFDKEEQKEETENEPDDDILSLSGHYSSNPQSVKATTQISSANFATRGYVFYSLPLFIVFQSWKLYI